MGEPIRCRHDRASRVFVRLLRYAQLRRAADAGDGFPVPAVLSTGQRRQDAQVDLRPENIGRRTPIDLGIVGDVRATLAQLQPLLKAGRSDAHLAKARGHYAKARNALDELAAPSSSGRLIHPQQVAKALSDQAAEDAIFSVDVGLPIVWAARYLAMNGKRRLVGSFLHGSMANAMPQAIGAQAAFPGRQVISMSGDGGFTMLMGDFLAWYNSACR